MRNDKRNKAVNELRQKEIDELKKLQNELLNKINHVQNELMIENQDEIEKVLREAVNADNNANLLNNVVNVNDIPSNTIMNNISRIMLSMKYHLIMFLQII